MAPRGRHGQRATTPPDASTMSFDHQVVDDHHLAALERRTHGHDDALSLLTGPLWSLWLTIVAGRPLASMLTHRCAPRRFDRFLQKGRQVGQMTIWFNVITDPYQCLSTSCAADRLSGTQRERGWQPRLLHDPMIRFSFRPGTHCSGDRLKTTATMEQQQLCNANDQGDGYDGMRMTARNRPCHEADTTRRCSPCSNTTLDACQPSACSAFQSLADETAWPAAHRSITYHSHSIVECSS